MAEICTSRLRLRAPTQADATALARLMTPHISARLASWPPFLVPGTAELRVQQALAAQAAGLALPLVVCRREDGALLGWISASRAEADPRRAILTYWIGEEFHGHGVMREAALPALLAVFRVLEVAETRAAVQTDNLASRAVLRRLGMQPLGTGRIWCAARGREEPCEWWSIRRADLPGQTAPAALFMPASSSALATSVPAAPA